MGQTWLSFIRLYISYLMLHNKLTSKMSGFKQQYTLITSHGFCESGIQEEFSWWFWPKVCPGVAVKMLAGASVIWSFACIQSCFDCFQDGSHMWLLAEGLSFLLHMPLHRAVWVWSQQGCWLPSRVWSKSLKWEWGERKLQGLLWPSFRSYVLSLLAYPIPWDKVTKSKPSSRGEELSSISWMEEYQWSVGIFKTHHR